MKLLCLAAISACIIIMLSRAADQIRSTYYLRYEMEVESRGICQCDGERDVRLEPAGLLEGFGCRQEQAESLDR